MRALSTLFILTAVLASCSRQQDSPSDSNEPITLIPQPAKILQREGHFVFNNQVRLAADFSQPHMNELVDHYLENLLEITGHRLKIQDLFRSDSKAKTIELVIEPSLQREFTYELLVVANKITVKARSIEGLNYGWHSCQALIAQNWTNGESVIPSLRILDQPSFDLRGVIINPEDDLNNMIQKAEMYNINLLVYLEEDKENDNILQNYEPGAVLTSNVRIGIISPSNQNTEEAIVTFTGKTGEDQSIPVTRILFNPNQDEKQPEKSGRSIFTTSNFLSDESSWIRFSEAAW